MSEQDLRTMITVEDTAQTQNSSNPNNVGSNRSVGSVTNQNIEMMLGEVLGKLNNLSTEMRAVTTRMDAMEEATHSVTSSSNAETNRQPRVQFEDHGLNSTSINGNGEEEEALGTPNLCRLLEAVVRTSEGSQYIQLQQSLPKLSGSEGRTKVDAYFKGFEIATKGWNSERRATLLANKLIGQAKVIYEGLSHTDREDYFKIRASVTRINNNDQSTRISAQNKLLKGINLNREENLREYGMRVLGIVRDASVVGTIDATVEDWATTYFLDGIKNRNIRSSLVLIRDSLNFFQLIDKAAALEEADRVHAPSWNNNSRNNNVAPMYKPENHVNQGTNINNGNIDRNAKMIVNKGTGANAQPIRQTFAKGNAMLSGNGSEKTWSKAILKEIHDAGGAEGRSTSLIFIGNGKLVSKNLVEAKDPEKPGIEFAIIDPKNLNIPIGIGRVKGKEMTVNVSIHGHDTVALLDTGANINTISISFLGKLSQLGIVDLENCGIHDALVTSSVLADKHIIEFPSAVSLPVCRSDWRPTWTEFQITRSQMYPLILGTATLSQCGYSLLDKANGKDLLVNEEDQQETNNAILAYCAHHNSIYPHSKKITKMKIPFVEDGDYIFNMENESAGALVNVKDGKCRTVLENREIIQKSLVLNEVIGQLEPVDNIICHTEISGYDTKPVNIAEIDERLQILLENIIMPTGIDPQQTLELHSLLKEYNDVFALSDDEMGQTDIVEHKIELENTLPFRIPKRPVPFAYKEKVSEMIDDYLKRKVVRPSSSPYSSPITLVKKKSGELRFCIDYRKLNSLTKKDAYPIPDVDSMLLSFNNKKFFSSLDLISGYWQVKMHPDSIEKTAFASEQGLYEFIVMPFGLTNAPATFERLMESILRGFIGDFVHVYLDDVLISSESWPEHLEHLRKVFQRLRESQLKLKPKKCKIMAEKIEFLGHSLTTKGLQMNEEKIRVIKDFPAPKDKKELQRFLGLTGYYRKFIKGFALIAKPLYHLIRNAVDWVWTEACEESYKTLISKICEDVTLVFPDFEGARDDPTKKFLIQTDASKVGLAGILSQYDGNGNVRPIYFVSRLCKETESRYAATELEALALKFAVNKFGPYIIGMNAIVETDHSALVQMFSKPKECGSARVNKWAMEIQSKYHLKIIYKPGKNNANADAISRAIIAAMNEVNIDDEFSSGKISREEWVAEQLISEFGHLLKFMTDRTLPKEEEKLAIIMQKINQFSIRNGCLYFVDPISADLKLFVPEKYRKKLFDERHNGPIGGHMCGKKIYEQLKTAYFWVNMRGDCEKWSKECQICVFCREPRKNKPPLKPIEVSAPWELLCLDILQLGLTSNGYKNVLMIIDHFTKYLIAVPLYTKSADEVARALVEKVILVYGNGKKIYSDQGKEFLNQILECVCEIMQISQGYTAGYNPRANGAVERANKTLIHMLMKTCPVAQEWDVHLPFIAFSYNITPHASTGEAPYFCVFGHDPVVPSFVDDELLPHIQLFDIEDYKDVMAVNIKLMVDKVNKNLETARQRFKKDYDKSNKITREKYKVGDRVMLEVKKVKGKLDWPFTGPYRIITIEEPNAQLTLMGKTSKIITVPIDRLSKVPNECLIEIGENNITKARNKFLPGVNVMLCSQQANHIPCLLLNSDINMDCFKEKIGKFESHKKSVFCFDLFEPNIGPLTACDGTGHEHCQQILPTEILPGLSLASSLRETRVLTFAAQLSIRMLQKESEEKAKDGLRKIFGEKNASKQLALALATATAEEIVTELQRRSAKCQIFHKALLSSGSNVLRLVGQLGSAVHTQIQNGMIVHGGQCFADKYGQALEIIKFKIMNQFSMQLAADPFLVMAPNSIETFGEPPLDDSKILRFPDLAGLLTKLRTIYFAGSVQSVALFLPCITEGYPNQLEETMNVLSSIEHVSWNIILPAPFKGALYDKAIDTLVQADSIIPNIKSKHQYKQRNLYSLGWTGESINMFHAKEGHWTKHGMDVIRAFLRCVDVPFPLKPEDPKVISKPLPPAKGKNQQLPSIIHRVSIQPNRQVKGAMHINPKFLSQGQNNRNNERGQYKGRRQGRSRSPISPIRVRSGHSVHSSSSANRRR